MPGLPTQSGLQPDPVSALGGVVAGAAGITRPAGHLCALIDDGDGPRMVFVDSRDLPRIGGVGSPLGRALVGARPGDRIRVRDPQRPVMVRLVELYPL